VAATTTTLVSLDQQNDEVHEYQSILIEQTFEQEVRFSTEDAEELHAKVTAQKQYKESVDGDLDIGLDGGLLELQEDVDLQPNEQQSIVVHTKSRPSISSKEPRKKIRSSPKNTLSVRNAMKSDLIHLASQLSPSHQKNIKIEDGRLTIRRSKRVFSKTKK
jgi:hypothetical protein